MRMGIRLHACLCTTALLCAHGKQEAFTTQTWGHRCLSTAVHVGPGVPLEEQPALC